MKETEFFNIVRSKEIGGVKMLNIAFLGITATSWSVSPHIFVLREFI